MLFIYLCVVAFAILMTLNAKAAVASADTSPTNAALIVCNGLIAIASWGVAILAPIGWITGH